MGGWMFFPSYNPGRNWSLEDFLDGLPSLDSQLSRDEWHEHVPESRERLQGRSLGFFCGGAKSSCVPADLPAYPMAVFVSDLMIMASCWTSKEVFSVLAALPDEYRIADVISYRFVITVTGTLPDRPPWFRVCGSYCFFPPPYVMAPGH